MFKNGDRVIVVEQSARLPLGAIGIVEREIMEADEHYVSVVFESNTIDRFGHTLNDGEWFRHRFKLYNLKDDVETNYGID